jgi:type IV pilus assembly protein PilQ
LKYVRLIAVSLACCVIVASAPQERTLSIDLKDADLTDVLRYFGKVARINLVVDPEVKGTVTMRLVDVPWPSALEQLLRVHGLAAEVDDNILRIAPVEKLIKEAEAARELKQARKAAAATVTILFQVAYADPEEVAEALRESVLGPRGRVQVYRPANLLIVNEVDDSESLARVRAAVGRADR